MAKEQDLEARALATEKGSMERDVDSGPSKERQRPLSSASEILQAGDHPSAVRDLLVDPMDEYFASVEAKVNEWQYDKSSKILRSVFRHNLFRTRSMLYKDYMSGSARGVPSEQDQVQLHIDQYLRAEKSYKIFKETHKAAPYFVSISIEGPLAMLAARLAVIEDYERRERETPDEIRRIVIGLAKKDLSVYYEASFILDNDGALAEETIDNYYDVLPERMKAGSAFLSRLKMAIFGGFALVVPMLIMTLHATKLTVLLTTTVFVLAVAIILAAAMKSAESKDVIGATAAYAAVLVVFVGVGTTANDGGLGDGLIGGIVAGTVAGLVLLVFILLFPALWIYDLWQERKYKLEHPPPDDLETTNPVTGSDSKRDQRRSGEP